MKGMTVRVSIPLARPDRYVWSMAKPDACYYHRPATKEAVGLTTGECLWLANPWSLKGYPLLTWSSAACAEDLSSLDICWLRDKKGQIKSRIAYQFTIKPAVQTSYCKAQNVSSSRRSFAGARLAFPKCDLSWISAVSVCSLSLWHFLTTRDNTLHPRSRDLYACGSTSFTPLSPHLQSSSVWKSDSDTELTWFSCLFPPKNPMFQVNVC